MRVRSCAAALLWCFTAGLALAVETVEPPLPADKESLGKIEGLPDNTWLKLPPVKVAGNLGWLTDPDKRRFGPRCRDYSNWMAWAPERKRALYCGGGHNIDPMNDVWEYDLAANTWVCLLPPDSIVPLKPREQPLAEFVKANATLKDGVVTTRSGGPLRPAHTWCGLCYDPERRRMLFLEPHQGLLFTDKAEVARAFGLTPEQFNAQRKPGSYIWTFDPVARKWDDVQTDVAGGEGAILLYVDHLKTVWVKSAGGPTALYDRGKRAWNPLAKCPVGYGSVGAYDPDTKAVVVINASRNEKTPETTYQTYRYSFDADQWATVQEQAPAGGRDASCHFHYDTVARRFVLITNAAEPRLWLYDPAKNEWTDPKPQGDIPPKGRLAGYYDPERNVTVNYDGKDIWVYRCKRREAKP
jgi:hypothetical protein